MNTNKNCNSFFSIRFHRTHYSQRRCRRFAAFVPFAHEHLYRSIQTKRITKQLPERWTEKKNAVKKCTVAYFMRSGEGSRSLQEEKEVIFLYYTWEVGFFYPIWITPSVWQNHLIHAGKSENFITKSTMGYSCSLRWLNMTNKEPHRTSENIVRAKKKKRKKKSNSNSLHYSRWQNVLNVESIKLNLGWKQSRFAQKETTIQWRDCFSLWHPRYANSAKWLTVTVAFRIAPFHSQSTWWLPSKMLRGNVVQASFRRLFLCVCVVAGQKESGMYSLTDEGDNTLSLDEMMPDSILISNLINPGRKSMFSVCGRRQYFYQQWLKSSFISSGTSCRFWFRHIISDPYIFRTFASVLARHTRIPASREVPVLVSMFWQGGAGRGWGGGEYSEEEGLLLCLLRGCEWCIDVVVWSNGHVKPWQLAAEQNCIS